jgi:hypothetical protein
MWHARARKSWRRAAGHLRSRVVWRLSGIDQIGGYCIYTYIVQKNRKTNGYAFRSRGAGRVRGDCAIQSVYKLGSDGTFPYPCKATPSDICCRFRLVGSFAILPQGTSIFVSRLHRSAENPAVVQSAANSRRALDVNVYGKLFPRHRCVRAACVIAQPALYSCLNASNTRTEAEREGVFRKHLEL